MEYESMYKPNISRGSELLDDKHKITFQVHVLLSLNSNFTWHSVELIMVRIHLSSTDSEESAT